MTHQAVWIDAMRTMPVAVVAAKMGMPIMRGGQSSGGSFPCPACGVEHRHASRRDRRGAAGMRSDGKGWRCFSCDAGGDALSLVSWQVAGTSRMSTMTLDQKRQVREECQRLTNCVTPDEIALAYAPPSAANVFPDADEVKALWKRSLRPTLVPSAMAWLAARGINAEQVQHADIARVLPDTGSLPKWALDWRAYGNRLLVKMVDIDGVGRSIKARRLFAAREGAKSRAPYEPGAGYTVRGLVFASPAARLMLQGGTAPARVVFVEGEKSTMQMMKLAPEAGVIGIGSGAISKELAAKVPASCAVTIATDKDLAGAKYATDILAAFGERPVRLARWFTNNGGKVSVS